MSNVYTFIDRETIEAEARQWLIRLDGDSPLKPEDLIALREWINRSSIHQDELRRISSFWGEANVLNELAIPLNKVQAKKHKSGLVGWLQTLKHITIPVASGVLIIALVLFGFYPNPSNSNGIYATAVGEVVSKPLSDGSIMYINTNSRLDVDFTNNIRKIRLLRGEAHFAVAKDRGRPFEVYAGESMVKATGTAFSVRLNNHEIEVTVTEGHVDLSNIVETPIAAINQKNPKNSNKVTASNSDNLIKLKKITSLKRGQSATITAYPTDINVGSGADYSPAAGKLKIESLPAAELSRHIAWRKGYLVFAGDPLSDVIKEVSRYTSVKVEIIDPALGQHRIGGRFQIGELEALFDVLEKNFDIKVNRLNHRHIQLTAARDQG